MQKSTKIWVSSIIVAIFVVGYYSYRHFAPHFLRGTRTYTIGILVRGQSYVPGVEGFKQKMKELGYREGENVTYRVHIVDKREDLLAAADDLVTAHVDVIHTYSTPATMDAFQRTKTIPIVFGSMGDPLASKTIQSLEHPGTNVTGIASLSAALVGKRLELLHAVVPSAKRIAFPYTPGDAPAESSYRWIRETAPKVSVMIVPYPITKNRDARATAGVILRSAVDGMVISSDSAVWAALPEYITQSIKEKIPFAVFDKDMVARGGLLGYGPDYSVTGAQAAVLVDKILHGQSPADLPIENPQKLIFAINLKTAHAIDITFPKDILQRADIVFDR